jgi:hypothetical protein
VHFPFAGSCEMIAAQQCGIPKAEPATARALLARLTADPDTSGHRA